MSNMRELTNAELDVVGGGFGLQGSLIDVPINVNFGQQNGNGTIGVNNGQSFGFGGNNFKTIVVSHHHKSM
jgi:hypothetical protein